jgi:hypothetical protein
MTQLQPGDLTAKDAREDNLLSRLEALERKIAELEAIIQSLVAQVNP